MSNKMLKEGLEYRVPLQDMAPINAECDRQGCQLSHWRVSLPDKMKRAFQHDAKAGWIELSMPILMAVIK